jgi:poly-gamma-glutamate capsule biosynthesis protein CapA/YwtB (metallophosphatase superfamily)
MRANEPRLGLLVRITALLVLLSGCIPASTTPSETAAAPRPTATFTNTPPPKPADTPTQPPTPSPTLSGQVQLIAVGDIMLARTVGEQILENGPQIVFEGVQDALDEGDLRLGNLECALTDVGTPEEKTYNLIAPPETVKALSLGKFDLLSLANNHALDNGPAGLADTMRILDEAGIARVGAGANARDARAPVFIQKNGLRMAFLAYVDVPVELDGFDTRAWIATGDQPGVAWAEPEQITLDVKAARLQADVVVVMLHSGNEISTYLASINPNQHQAARAAIDAGAALVVGSHPHVLQSIELYHGGLIAYSLGNFVFDQYLGIANATVILRVWLDRDGFGRYDYVPALIENGFPHVITPDRAPAISTLVAPVLNP